MTLLRKTLLGGLLLGFLSGPAMALDLAVAPGLPIPDDGYIGTGDGGDAFGLDAGMACATIDTTGLITGTVTSVAIGVDITHTWVGDLVFKLMSPDGSILALMSRPGSAAPDDATDTPLGDFDNIDGLVHFYDGAPTDAEAMGAAGGDVCTVDGLCDYFPNPGPAAGLADFAGFAGEAAEGAWTFCVGDAVGIDLGTLNVWNLRLNEAPGAPTNPCPLVPAGSCDVAPAGKVQAKYGKKFGWQAKDAGFAFADVGAPDVADAVQFCLWDELLGGGYQRLYGMDLEPGETWTIVPDKKAKHKDETVRAQVNAKGGAKLKSKTAPVSAPTDDGILIGQLSNPSTGLCIGTEHSGPHKKNDEKGFSAK